MVFNATFNNISVSYREGLLPRRSLVFKWNPYKDFKANYNRMT